MIQDFLTALLLFVVVVGLMVLLAPFALYVLGAIVLIVALLIVYYFRTVLIPVGVVLGGLYMIWNVATSIRVPSFTTPDISVPTIHVPRIILPTVPFAAIEAILFIILVGAAAFALMFGMRAVRGFITGYHEGRAGPTGEYFVREELREERETARVQARQPTPEPEPELEPVCDRDEDEWHIDPVHPD